MNILIDTGTLEIPGRLENTSETTVAEYNLTEPKIFPSDNDGDAIVAVAPMQMVVVTAYWADEGDPELQEVEVFKVLTSAGVPESGSAGCCPAVAHVPARIVRKVKLCGWELKSCDPTLVINTPGKYQFIPNNAAAGVILTAQILPLQEFNNGLDNSIRP